MKRHIAYAGLAVLLLSASAGSACLAAEPDLKLLGEAVPSSAAERTIVIQPNTAYVNVTGGDVVKFVIGGKTFTWDFDTAGNQTAFDLERIVPAGMLDHKVMVYVARDPTYFGGA